MKKVHIFKGLPASGKSTAAKKMLDENPGKYKRINKDDLRAMLDNSRHSSANEKFVLKIRDLMLLQALEAGKHVIIDDTNINPKHLNRIKELVKGIAEIEIHDFMHVDVETCIQRDLKRTNSVGERVIRRMWKEYLQFEGTKIHQNPELPHAILCDLDGTLALLNGRSPYDASTADQDLLNVPIAQIVRNAATDGLKIIFLTGREDQYQTPTISFIQTHFGKDFEYLLFMRESEDRRKDAIVKQEIFEAKILPNFYIDFVLDDRNQVVDMWRGLGLTCLQVDYGDF